LIIFKSALNGFTRVVQGIGFVMNILTVDSATCIDISIVSFLNEQFKPATQGVLFFVCVCLYVPTLRFFTGSRKGLSRGTGDIICTLSSSSVNHSFFSLFLKYMKKNYLT
jgi:hypothetical protein